MEEVASDEFPKDHREISEQSESRDTNTGVFLISGSEIDIAAMMVVMVAMASVAS